MDTTGEWFITNEAPLTLHSPHPEMLQQRWQEPTHCSERCLAYIIIAGEEIASTTLTIPIECHVSLRVMPGLDRISSDGLRYELFFVDGSHRLPVLSGSFVNELMPSKAQTVSVDASHLSGRVGQFVLRCDAGPQGHPEADWLAVVGFAVGRVDRISLLHARSNRQWRIANEIAHFTNVYDHKIYQTRAQTNQHHSNAHAHSADVIAPLTTEQATRNRESQHSNLIAEGKKRAEQIQPNPNEDAYHYGSRLLGALVGIAPPNFGQRARDKAGQLSVLSICCGEAGIEASLLAPVMDRLHLVLLDINESLLKKAAARFDAAASCTIICGDVNNLPLLDHAFDIIVIASALHHVVELENFSESVRLMLKPDGEFWVIGENIGRTGSRLTQDAYAKANSIFRDLPKRFKKNRSTGKTDNNLPNIDCSSACFEGIRSDEIVPNLRTYFSPIDEYTRNCFLWRLLDLAYVDNYNLSKSEDLNTVRELCIRDWTYWCEGGSATELHGIYKRKDTSNWIAHS